MLCKVWESCVCIVKCCVVDVELFVFANSVDARAMQGTDQGVREVLGV